MLVGFFSSSEPAERNIEDSLGIRADALDTDAEITQVTRMFQGKAYDFISSITLNSAEESVTVGRYERGPVREFSEESAVVLLLSGRGITKTLAIPKEYGGQIRLLEVPEPILTISSPMGGNGWKRSPHLVLSLNPDNFLEKIGQMDWIVADDLVMVDNTFEANPWLGRAGSPHARIYYTVKNGTLSSDKPRNRIFWNGMIKSLSADMDKIPNAPPEGLSAEVLIDNPALQKILTRLLYFRLSGALDEGQRATERDLVRCFGRPNADMVLREISKSMNRKLAHAALFLVLDGQCD